MFSRSLLRLSSSTIYGAVIISTEHGVTASTLLFGPTLSLFAQMKLKLVTPSNRPSSTKLSSKYLCYTRELTCSIDALPSLLAKALLLAGRLNDLIGINLVINPDNLTRPSPSHGRSTQGLDDLSTVIASCSKLHVVSIESMSTYHDSEIEDFFQFVKFLDDFPTVTRLYISFRASAPNCEQAPWMVS